MSATQRWMDAVSGNYGSTSGLYGHGPIQSYTRPISIEQQARLTELYSNPTHGKAHVDRFGRVLGYEKIAGLIAKGAEQRLYARAMGACTGPGGGACLSPEMIDRFRGAAQSAGLSDTGVKKSVGSSIKSSFAPPGVGVSPAPAPPTIAPGMDPMMLYMIGGAALLLLLVLKNK